MRGKILFCFVMTMALMIFVSAEISQEEIEDIVNSLSIEEIKMIQENFLDDLSAEDIERLEESLPENFSIEDLENLPDDFLETYLDQVDKSVMAEYFLNDISCEMAKFAVENKIVGVQIPDQVPIKSEVFEVYLDEKLIASVVMENKNITGFYCESPAKATYKIYVTSALVLEVMDNPEEINPFDFYLEKKKSGDLSIKAVGFFRKIKLGFLNLGIRIVSWFI